MSLRILLLVLFLTLNACSQDEQFACNGWGLKLTSNSALYGPMTLNYCNKSGVQKTYQSDCNSKDGYYLIFDTVTYEVTTFNTTTTLPMQRTQCAIKK